MKLVALLRGINVGGHKKIKMADLRALFGELGFGDVQTYIQSGNVIFDPAGADEAEAIERISKGIRGRFGFEVPVIVREHEELDAIISESPFPAFDAAQEGAYYAVSFLAETPANEKIDAIQPFVKPPEELVVQGRQIYLHCPNGFGRSKLSPALLEGKLGVTATTRNWKSLLKLRELSKPEAK